MPKRAPFFSANPVCPHSNAVDPSLLPAAAIFEADGGALQSLFKQGGARGRPPIASRGVGEVGLAEFRFAKLNISEPFRRFDRHGLVPTARKCCNSALARRQIIVVEF